MAMPLFDTLEEQDSPTLEKPRPDPGELALGVIQFWHSMTGGL
jgi:hypothetical protein